MKKYDKTILLEKWQKAYKLLVENENDPEKFALMCKVLEKLEDQLREIGATEKDYITQRGVETFTSLDKANDKY